MNTVITLFTHFKTLLQSCLKKEEKKRRHFSLTQILYIGENRREEREKNFLGLQCYLVAWIFDGRNFVRRFIFSANFTNKYEDTSSSEIHFTFAEKMSRDHL